MTKAIPTLHLKTFFYTRKTHRIFLIGKKKRQFFKTLDEIIF